MGFESFSKKFSKATEATQSFISKKWDDSKGRFDAVRGGLGRSAEDEAAAKAAAEELALQKERNAFLAPIAAKLEASGEQGPSVAPGAPTTDHKHAPAAAAPATSLNEMEQPLVYSRDSAHRAVLLITTPIEFGPIELSKQSYRLLARHVGMSMNSICHWALCVIDRGVGKSYSYDLMSDRLELNMLGKNVFRVNEVTPDYVATWSSCYYVGETTKSHDEIELLGRNHMALHPRYSLLESNCQHLAETLVRALCDGRIISQHKLDEELSLVSPKIAMDLMMSKLQARLDDPNDENEDGESVKKDVDVIGKLWGKVKKFREDDTKVEEKKNDVTKQ